MANNNDTKPAIGYRMRPADCDCGAVFIPGSRVVETLIEAAAECSEKDVTVNGKSVTISDGQTSTKTIELIAP